MEAPQGSGELTPAADERWTSEYWAAMGELSAHNYLWYCEYDGNLLDLVETGELPPAPFSGEHAGFSVPELFASPVGAEPPDDAMLEEFERAFARAFVDTLVAANKEWEEKVARSAAEQAAISPDSGVAPGLTR